MKAAGHVLPLHVCSPVRAGPEPQELRQASRFQCILSLSGNVSRPGGYVYPGGEEEVAELGLGQRALWGVLLDLAACPMVTQAC